MHFKFLIKSSVSCSKFYSFLCALKPEEFFVLFFFFVCLDLLCFWFGLVFRLSILGFLFLFVCPSVIYLGKQRRLV